MKTVVVKYSGKPIPELDNIINKALTDAGLKEYAQGGDYGTQRAEHGHGCIVRRAGRRSQRPALPRGAGSGKLAPSSTIRTPRPGGFA